MTMSNCLNEYLVLRLRLLLFSLMGVNPFDIANTLWPFYMKNLSLWKIFSNWPCMCHCIVTFLYLLKSWNLVWQTQPATQFLKQVMLKITSLYHILRRNNLSSSNIKHIVTLQTICAVVVLPIPGGPDRSTALWPAPSSFARIFTTT